MSIVSAIVLAGGRGTRSADPGRPKLGQVIAERDLLKRHLDLLEGSSVDELLIVAGHLGEQVDALASSVHPSKPPVRVIHEVDPRGTTPAVAFGASHLASDRFLIILGDILLGFPVDDFLAAWERSGKSVAVIVHPSSHPADSDAVFAVSSEEVWVTPKSQSRDHIPNMSSTGLFAITRDGLGKYSEARDFGSDLLPLAATNSDLFVHVSSHYFKDTGTPDRLAKATNDVESGAFERRGNREPRPALFLDRDGVINPALPEIHRPEDFTLNSGVADVIASTNALGIPIIVVTNQPGLAKGFMDSRTHIAIRARMDALLGEAGAFVDDYFFCPHHPDSGFPGEVADLKIACACRKPLPGMLLAAAEAHGLDLSRSVMVGDTWRDKEAAEAAGVTFIGTGDLGDVRPSEAIFTAIEVISC